MNTIHKYKEFLVSKCEIVQPIHTKALLTLEKLLSDTQMGHLYQELERTHKDETVDNTLHIILKIKYLLKVRSLLLKIIKVSLLKEQTLICLKKLLLCGKVDSENWAKMKKLREDYEDENMIFNNF